MARNIILLCYLAPIGYVPPRGDEATVAPDHTEVELTADALHGAVVLPDADIEHPTSANARLRLRQSVGGDMEPHTRANLRRELERRRPVGTATLELGTGTRLRVVGLPGDDGLPRYGVTPRTLQQAIDEFLDDDQAPRRRRGKGATLYEDPPAEKTTPTPKKED